jgi:hypothetical protein
VPKATITELERRGYVVEWVPLGRKAGSPLHRAKVFAVAPPPTCAACRATRRDDKSRGDSAVDQIDVENRPIPICRFAILDARPLSDANSRCIRSYSTFMMR